MACAHDWSNNVGFGAFCNHCGLVNLTVRVPSDVYTAAPIRQSLATSMQVLPARRSIAQRLFGSFARGIEQ